jgi:hypothetical protein
MARQLVSEKPFVVVVRDFEHMESWPRFYGIITSYTIMRAKIINLLNDDVFTMSLIENKTDYGTIVHIDTEENVQAALPLIPIGIRYFGYVNATEKIVVNNFAYIGLPISLNYMPYIETPEGMWDVVYPHITLSSLQNNKELNDDYIKMVGRGIEVKLCDVVTQTPHTLAYSAKIKDEDYHVTRCVANGKSPAIANKEMVKGINSKDYLSLVAFPVLM